MEDGAAATGEVLVFERDEPLAEGPRVVEETLALVWSAGDATLATQEIPLRMYAVYGPPTFGDRTGEVPYLPWVGVIDPALRAMDGVEPDREAVLDAHVDHIYTDLDIAYDTRWGASAYLSYSGYGYEGAAMNLSGFLSRSRGDIVNCSDCSGILMAFANMLGLDLDYAIIRPSFNLNYIQAIGYDEFTHCPFGSYSCGFSYHAVTTTDMDEASSIWDATLALDGDDDPSSEPNEVMMVHGVSGDEYLERLVMSGSPSYSTYDKGTLR